ncbi:MAG: hypothetical protein CVU38_01625 [Chloroflexi bacterium HGW-Chloroflexi-1]|nr:MAG: hypothetical protein CVU38_01625 [Chloroflexi bacterium HGW-Chloroflexi-1]
MRFEPKPEDEFALFITTYFQRCQKVCAKLQAIAGKWRFEDLIPGLSDFDTRFIFESDTSVSDWIQMSIAVGQAHTELARQHPRWARILEHLPGVNLTHAEMLDPVLYYPEFQQWTFYGGNQAVLDSIRTYLEEKPWTRRDELFHLKKFAVYYGPYQRGIDPLVNVGAWENKYPLHSRFMHYFAPPVQSAVSLVQRRGVCGKMEALRLARDLFPHPEVIDMVLETVARHYEAPEYYAEPRLSEIERTLENYLYDVYRSLADHVTLIEVAAEDTPAQLRRKLAQASVDPVEQFYEGAKFSRFMKGRLLFYATNIAWFDTTWLIQTELGRIVTNFYEKPLHAYSVAQFHDHLPLDAALDRLRGSILPPEVCAGVRRFVGVARTHIPEGAEKKQAHRVAEVFEPVQWMLELLGAELRAEGRMT